MTPYQQAKQAEQPRRNGKTFAQLAAYSTEQLKDALLGLYEREGAAALAAYQMTFDELERRLGEEALDAWLTSKGL